MIWTERECDREEMEGDVPGCRDEHKKRGERDLNGERESDGEMQWRRSSATG